MPSHSLPRYSDWSWKKEDFRQIGIARYMLVHDEFERQRHLQKQKNVED